MNIKVGTITLNRMVVPEGLNLLPFQEKAVSQMLEFLDINQGVYNACEQGLGKTIQTIVALNALNVTQTLIICPAVMRLVWEEELKIWSTTPGNCTKVVLNSGDMAGLFNFSSPSYLIISYDLAARHAAELEKHNWHALVMDESHMLKSKSAKRTKAILGSIWEKADYKIALSGTPFTQSVIDGFTLFNKFLPSRFTNFYQFANRYAYQRITPWGVKYFGVRNAEELSKIIRANFYIRYTKEQVLPELPEKVFQKISLPESFGVGWKKEKEVLTDANEAVAAISSGRNFKVAGNLATLRKEQGLLKIPAIVEFAKNLLEQEIPIVLFAYHRMVIAKLQEELEKFKPVVITGDTSAEDRQSSIKAFQEGKAHCFIGQINASGTGITLHRSSIVILGELDWSPAVISQAVDRCHRIGQKDTVNVHYFVVKNSLEEKIVNVVMDKAKTFAKVLED